MRFENLLLEMLLEGKIEDTLARHPTIPEHIKQDYLRQIPANNAQHLDWILQQHSKGNIKPVDDIHNMLSSFNKVKEKLPKKQLHQYKSIEELHSAIQPHLDIIKKSDKEKKEEGTETLYSSPTMTIKQHHNYESCVNAGVLPSNNRSKSEKARWCISVGNGGGAAHHDYYTASGFHPVYTIEHHHPDGTSNKHMFVYDYNKPDNIQELRDENDTLVSSSGLNNYAKKYPEIKKTSISNFFNSSGREEYKKTVKPSFDKLTEIKEKIPDKMNDEEYMTFFKQGLQKKYGSIHNELAKKKLSKEQLAHLIEHGNYGSKANIAQRYDLTDEQNLKLANTSDMMVHYNLLHKNISDNVFDKIVQKAHPQIVNTLVSHQKFNKSHIDTVLNKNLPSYNELIKYQMNKLEPHHIDKIIDNDATGTDINLLSYGFAQSPKLTSSHIHKILDKKERTSTSSLIDFNSPKLDSSHIDKIINNNDSSIIEKLLNTDIKIEPHHIDNIIKKNDDNLSHSLIMRHSDKLSNDNINYLIKNNIKEGHESNAINMLIHKARKKLTDKNIDDILKDKSYHEAVSVFLKNYIKPHHIDKLIDNDDNGDISETLISNLPLNSHHIDKIISKNRNNLNELLVDSQKNVLEPHHIKKLLPTNEDIKTAISNNDLDYLKNVSVIKNMHVNDVDTVLKKSVSADRRDVINEILSHRNEPDTIDKMLIHHFSHPRNIDKLKNQVSILDDDMKNSIYHTTEDERIKKLVRG